MHCKFSLNPQLPLYADLLDFLDEPDPLVLSSIDPHAPHPMPFAHQPKASEAWACYVYQEGTAFSLKGQNYNILRGCCHVFQNELPAA